MLIKANSLAMVFKIHILDNLHKEYDIILDGLENCLPKSDNDALTIKVKIKNKNEEEKKEETLAAYWWQYKSRCSKCGKYGHESTVLKCP